MRWNIKWTHWINDRVYLNPIYCYWDRIFLRSQWLCQRPVDDLNVNLLHGNFTSAVENVRIHVCLDVTYAKFSKADASSSCTISRRSVRTVKCLTQNIFILWYSMISSMSSLVKGRKEKTSIYCKYCVTLKNLRKIWSLVLDVFTAFSALSGLGGSKRIWWESKEFQLRWGLRTLSGVPWCLQWGQAEPLLSSSRPARSRRKLQCQRRFRPHLHMTPRSQWSCWVNYWPWKKPPRRPMYQKVNRVVHTRELKANTNIELDIPLQLKTLHSRPYLQGTRIVCFQCYFCYYKILVSNNIQVYSCFCHPLPF